MTAKADTNLREALEPCPFCGSRCVTLLEGCSGCWFVRCDDCRASSDDVGQDRVIGLWNTRAALASEPVAGTDTSLTPASVRESVDSTPSAPASAAMRLSAGVEAPAPAGREAILNIFYKHIWRSEPSDMRKAIEKAADAILALGAAVPPQVLGAGEPVAWSYELATVRSTDGVYGGWGRRLSWDRPVTTQGSMRNLCALYATPPAPGAADRAAVIEECAKVAEIHLRKSSPGVVDEFSAYNQAVRDIAAKIRELGR